MRIFLTGANGFIGGGVASALIVRGARAPTLGWQPKHRSIVEWIATSL